MSVRKVHAAMCPACEAGVVCDRQPSAIRESFSFFLGFVVASRLQREKVDARDEASKSGFFCGAHGRAFRRILALLDRDEQLRRRAAS